MNFGGLRKTSKGAQPSFGGSGSDFGRDDGSSFRSDFGSNMSSDAGGARRGRPHYKATISELYDDDEKDAIFRSSMKKGGAVHEFNMSFKPQA